MKTKKAVAGTTARQNECQSKSYLSVKSLSTLKIIIGGFLLFGDRKAKVFWPFLEAMLRQYLELKTSGGEHES